MPRLPAPKMEVLEAAAELDSRVSALLRRPFSSEPLQSMARPALRMLEISCHGIPWLVVMGLLMVVAPSLDEARFYQWLFVCLLVDILMVSSIKYFVPRDRPPENQPDDMFLTFMVDQHSFPSGHSSRAVLLYGLLAGHGQVPYPPFLLAWSFCVCLSRVLLCRHYLGDVLVGAGLGYFQYRQLCSPFFFQTAMGWLHPLLDLLYIS